MSIFKENFQVRLKNWALKQLTPANVQAILTAALARLREIADDTSIKIDDWALDFLESIVQDPVKCEKLTDFIRHAIAPEYGDGEFSDGPYSMLGRALESENVCSASAISLVQVVQMLTEIMPLIIQFFRKKEEN